tara:strand:- start:95 stop:280 length:186 start_codon:yes stop_codon:yes gene_type:complete
MFLAALIPGFIFFALALVFALSTGNAAGKEDVKAVKFGVYSSALMSVVAICMIFLAGCLFL